MTTLFIGTVLFVAAFTPGNWAVPINTILLIGLALVQKRAHRSSREERAFIVEEVTKILDRQEETKQELLVEQKRVRDRLVAATTARNPRRRTRKGDK